MVNYQLKPFNLIYKKSFQPIQSNSAFEFPLIVLKKSH